MSGSKADIIAQLQKEILPLQGFRSSAKAPLIDLGLGAIRNAFPNRSFPLGAIHEFSAPLPEQAAATGGFIAAMLSSLMQNGIAVVWISLNRTVFPPALKQFQVDPARVIFIDLQRSKDILWATEEALKCGGLGAVISEIAELGFTASRRFQLAVEQSGVTGFILRTSSRKLTPTASLTRWIISPLPSISMDGLPGVGFPRWNVQLQKVRNGKPGSWDVEYVAGRLRHLTALKAVAAEKITQTA